MWLFCLYDVPMKTAEQKKEYSRFHKKMLELGFLFELKSCYCMNFENLDRAKVMCKKVSQFAPKEGELRFIFVSDTAYQKQVIYNNAKKEKPRKQPTLFDFI